MRPARTKKNDGSKKIKCERNKHTAPKQGRSQQRANDKTTPQTHENRGRRESGKRNVEESRQGDDETRTKPHIATTRQLGDQNLRQKNYSKARKPDIDKSRKPETQNKDIEKWINRKDETTAPIVLLAHCFWNM